MFYTVYKTTNTVNGKFYIGKHQTLDLNDTYLGSGKALYRAIDKYGRDNFTKEILFVFDSEEEMNLKEKELVNEEYITCKNNYNTGIGGEGGPQFKGKSHSLETKLKLAEIAKGRVVTLETKEKIAESNRRRKVGGWKRPDTALRNSLRKKVDAG